jgi:hypothetical protein
LCGPYMLTALICHRNSYITIYNVPFRVMENSQGKIPKRIMPMPIPFHVKGKVKSHHGAFQHSGRSGVFYS